MDFIYGSRPSEVQICKVEVITLTTVAVVVEGVPSKNFEPNISVICQLIFRKFKI
jgi:hypothetical protein